MIGGLPAAVVAPKRRTAATTHLIYLHGGGYINPITTHHWRLIAALTVENAWTVTVPLYRLAPEGDATEAPRSPSALHQTVVSDMGVAPVLGGDSAGGGLALVLDGGDDERGAPGSGSTPARRTPTPGPAASFSRSSALTQRSR